MTTFPCDSRKEFALSMRRFTGHLEGHSVSPAAELETIIAPCTEELKDTLVICTKLEPEEGYKEAIEMLREII